MANEIIHRKVFTLDGQDSWDFHVQISGSGTYGSAERDIETQHLPFRNGDLLNDNGCFHNRIITYPCWIAHTFKDDFDTFRDWLMQHTDKYYKLTDSYHPDHFFMARVVSPIEPEVLVRGRAGTFTVTFDCMPQWFRDSGDGYRDIEAGTLVNPTNFPARPVLRIIGKGCTVKINDQTITVSEDMPYVIEGTDTPSVRVDCDEMDAYALLDVDENEKANANKYVSMPLEYIELKPGENTISLSSCSLRMIPRWYDM